MPRFPSVIEIAGIVYTGCRGLLIDGHQFADSVKGSVEWAMDSTPHPQTIDTQFKGVQFGFQLGMDDGAVTIEKVAQTVQAIKDSRASIGHFPFYVVDSQYTIDVDAVPDYTQVWYNTGRYSDGYVKEVVFRFIVMQANEVILMGLPEE